MSFRLYGESLWISPYVFSSYVALREKRIDFDLVEVTLFRGDHLADDYAARSLTTRVPCLEHDDFSLSESSAIAEYLEELFPAPQYTRLLPEDPRQRARARQLMAWLRSDLGSLREERSTVTMFYRFELGPLGAAAKRDVDKLVRICQRLVSEQTAGLFGEWSLLDSELSFMLQRLLLNGHELPAHVRHYAERHWQRPSVQEFVTHARPLEVPEGYWAYSGTPRPRAK